jgi:hypothetical protein
MYLIMRHLIVVMLLLSCTSVCVAQDDKKEEKKEAREERTEERKEAKEEKNATNRNKVDYNVFRRQILALPEFAAQRAKLPEMRKTGTGIPKIYAVVDSSNDSEDGKFLTGFIQLSQGDNSANVYEVTFDRMKKKISMVKPTGEAIESEAQEKAEQKGRSKTTAKKSTKKKTDDDEDDDDEDEPEDKPVKGKQTEEED